MCAGKQAHLLREGWGDDEKIQTEALNKHYDGALYAGFRRSVHTNLARLDESAIDYDLLDELVRHIDTTEDPGAILVFLPGLPEIMNLVDRLNGSHQCAPAPLLRVAAAGAAAAAVAACCVFVMQSPRSACWGVRTHRRSVAAAPRNCGGIGYAHAKHKYSHTIDCDPICFVILCLTAIRHCRTLLGMPQARTSTFTQHAYQQQAPCPGSTGCVKPGGSRC